MKLKKFIFLLFLISLIFPLLAAPAGLPQQPVDLLFLKGVINPVMADYLVRGIKQGEKDGAIVVIQMDTPGGLDGPMRKIIQQILQSEVPVVTFVYPQGARAASAGVFIAYASNLIAMAQGTNIGAAHPVFISPMGASQGKEQEKVMSEKAINDMVALIHAVAQQRGRNAQWGEDAVRKSVSLSAQSALKEKVIDLMADDLPGLLTSISGKKVIIGKKELILNPNLKAIKKIEMTAAEKFLFIITEPTIAFILFLLGLMGLYYELSNPGLILPGIVGGICLILALYALGTLPVNYAGVFLIVFAFILFIADLYAPTHGFLTFGGIVSLVLGALMLLPAGPAYLRISRSIIVLSVLVVGGFFFFVMSMVVTTFKRKSLVGKQGMLGAVGIARTQLAPEGRIFVEGELWNARAKSGDIQPGEKVKVIKIKDLNLLVEKVAEDVHFAPEEKV